MRDITLEDTFLFNFSTRAFATGIPTTLAGTPVLSVKETGNDTVITAGISVDIDTGSGIITGFHEGTVVATAANGYENKKSYSVYISTGTVGGVSVVGELVHEFTIGLSAATIDLANATDGLSALKTILDAIPTTAMRGTDSALTDKDGFTLSTAGILAVWHQAMSAVVTVGSAGKLLKDEMTVARMAVLTDWINDGRLDLLLDAIPTTAMRGTDSAALASEVTAARMSELDAGTGGKMANQVDEIRTDTTEIGVAGLGLGDLGGMSTGMKAEVNTEVDGALDTTIPELGVAAPTATPTIRTALILLYMLVRNKLVVQTSGTDAIEVYNDAGTKIASKTITDDGTDYTEDEMA